VRTGRSRVRYRGSRIQRSGVVPENFVVCELLVPGRSSVRLPVLGRGKRQVPCSPDQRSGAVPEVLFVCRLPVLGEAASGFCTWARQCHGTVFSDQRSGAVLRFCLFQGFLYLGEAAPGNAGAQGPSAGAALVAEEHRRLRRRPHKGHHLWRERGWGLGSYAHDRGRLVKFAFVPTPEHPVEGVEMFLPASPMQLMKEGRHHAVPFMTGITSREGLLTLAFKDYRDQEVGAALDAAWEQNVLPELRLPADGPKNAQALAALRRFYMAGQPLSEATRDGYMFSDIQFGEGVDLAVKYLAKTPKAPVYLYYFMVDDQLNFLKLAWKLNEHGACHADENGYLFYTNRWDPDLPPNSTAVNPTPNDDSLLGAHWKPYTEHEHNYLEIGAELRPKMELNADRVAFWEEFYKKYSS
ncbi:Carboxylesterase CarE-8 variant 1, partial [Gryllus bimaculatus]